jgi:hypothetical protein
VTLGRTLNDDLYEWSLKHDDWVRPTRAPGGEDRDGDADTREQYHPAEGEKDLREKARARSASNLRGSWSSPHSVGPFTQILGQPRKPSEPAA